jgi:hypothetical protein
MRVGVKRVSKQKGSHGAFGTEVPKKQQAPIFKKGTGVSLLFGIEASLELGTSAAKTFAMAVSLV